MQRLEARIDVCAHATVTLFEPPERCAGWYQQARTPRWHRTSVDRCRAWLGILWVSASRTRRDAMARRNASVQRGHCGMRGTTGLRRIAMQLSRRECSHDDGRASSVSNGDSAEQDTARDIR